MSVYPEERHAYLCNKLYDTDDRACFIERERILQDLDVRLYNYYAYDREAIIFRELLERISAPVDPMDVFVGRVIEALPDEGMGQAKRIRYRFGEEACLRDTANDTSVTFPNPLLYSFGHMCYDWGTLLTKGYRGVLETIEASAKQQGDPTSQLFLNNARIVIHAIRDYAHRYAEAAEAAGNHRAAEALHHVPFEPAYDLYSALSSMWLVHMMASCFEGARDFAFGRFDQYLYPFYRADLDSGKLTREAAVDLISYFLIKPNEICGMSVFNDGNRKPVPCDTSKQYLLIGGTQANDLSIDLLLAAKRNNLPQPVVTVLWMKEQSEEFRDVIFDVQNTLADKIHVYNFNKITEILRRKGVPQKYIDVTTFSGCCSMEFSHYNTRNEYYINTPKVLCELLGSLGSERKDYHCIEEILADFTELCRVCLQEYIDYITRAYGRFYTKHTTILDSLLICQCAEKCRYPGEGGAYPVRLYNIFLAGLATVADALLVLDRLVFREKRYTFEEYMNIVDSDFRGNELLLAEVRNMTRFGNDDDDADSYAVKVGNALEDAIDAVAMPPENYMIGSFYSLDRSYIYGKDLPGTPDGRLYGDYISENQSPTYGAPKNGATAELNSVSKLPFYRSGGGGYNLTLSKKLDTKTLKALIESYFEMGGLHVGITYVDRSVLEDAMVNPDQYKSLTVRLYGFSEYFVKIPKWQQIEYLERTAM